MITPWALINLYGLGAFVTIVLGVCFTITEPETSKKIIWICLAVFGPIVLRFAIEALMVFFRINETLSEIQEVLEEIADRGQNQEEEIELESLET